MTESEMENTVPSIKFFQVQKTDLFPRVPEVMAISGTGPLAPTEYKYLRAEVERVSKALRELRGKTMRLYDYIEARCNQASDRLDTANKHADFALIREFHVKYRNWKIREDRSAEYAYDMQLQSTSDLDSPGLPPG
ncbi:hypothetical protein EIP86_002461 [Pleurotus ostreatoroseus]|nr:hypothetical protein EIP86_002461 [Pleurotus ostreatoroseus]